MDFNRGKTLNGLVKKEEGLTMKKNISWMGLKVGAVLGLCIVSAPTQLHAVTVMACPPACVTSNLHKVILTHGWESSDHQPATGNLMKYYTTLLKNNSVTVDTFNAPRTIWTTSNLAQYDALIFFNMLQFMQAGRMDTATMGKAIQTWYESGKGLGCYHQCVKYWGSGPKDWLWYQTLMGVDYNTYAAVNVTGPVYVDSEGLGIIDSLKYKGQSFSWSDEWYTYVANPRGKPGVKMVWTTDDTKFGAGFNSTMGKDHPLAWTHDIDGGRFYLNSLFHNSYATTATGAVKAFIDEQFMASARYLAGYTGCKDTTYWEYNPQATTQAVGSCVTSRTTSVPPRFYLNDTYNGIQIGKFKVSISAPGSHVVELFNMRGKKVLAYRGNGPHEYLFSDIHEPGVYYVKVWTSSHKAVTRKIFLL